MDLLSLLSTNEIFVQIINFLLMFFLLKIVLWKRILGVMDLRREKVTAEFQGIEEKNKEAARLKAEYEEKLRGADDLKRIKIQEAMVEALKISEDIKKEALVQAKKIQDDAMANTAYEINKAKEGLRDKIVDLTMMAAEEIIEEKMSEDKDRQLVLEFLNKLDKAK